MASAETQGNPAGAPGAAHPEGEDRIPKARVDAMIASAKQEADARIAAAEERERLAQERAERAESNRPPPAPPRPARKFSAAELRRAVESGDITQEQMDAVIERQNEAAIESKVAEKVAVTTAITEVAKKRAKTIDDYVERIPALKNKKSDDFTRFQAEYQRLVRDQEAPENTLTEIWALGNVFGPVKKIRVPEEPHEETDSPAAAGGKAEPAQDTSSAPKWLDKRFTDHYERLMGQGHYPGGWEDPQLQRELGRIKAKGKGKAA